MHEEEHSLVGWYRVADSPDMLETIKKNKRMAMGWTWVFSLLFPAGFLIVGLFSDEMPLNEELVIGAGLGLLILAINLWRFAGLKKRAWDGVVVKKLKKRRYESSHDNTSPSYMEYIVVIRAERDRTKRIVERKWDREMYDYLNVGDCVRYHPALETYEKYDKSKDKVIY